MKLLFILLILLFPAHDSLLAKTHLRNIASKTIILMKEEQTDADDVIIRTPSFYQLNAYIEDTNLNLKVGEAVHNIEIIIRNRETGEIQYSEVFVKTYGVIIDLSYAGRGEYGLELFLNDGVILFYGDFNF